MKPAVKSTLKWTGIALLALVLLVASLITWIVNTQSGTRWAFARASAFLDQELSAQTIQGSLAGPLTLTQLTYRDPIGGIDFSAARIHVDIRMSEIFSGTVHIENAEANGIRVNLSESKKPPEPEQPFTLEPPIDLVLDRLLVRDVVVRNQEAEPIVISHVGAVARWTSSGIAVQRLDVNSPQGEIHFQGDVRQGEYYAGSGQGRFRWNTPTQRFAGTLAAQTREENATLTVRLTSPLRARLELQARQVENTPWTFALEVPRFDPREELLPDSSMQSLAASLRGAGTLTQGEVTGRVVLNDEPLRLDPIRFQRDEQTLSLDGVLRVAQSPGALQARGTVQLDREPVQANFDVKWNDLTIPERWAGQVLATRGDVNFNGSAEQYAAKGALSIGPPDRIADLRFEIDGSPQAIQLEQFDIVQQPGRLAARGEIGLQPELSWDVTANARQFDPGAFAPAWKGDLSFALASVGRITEAGPAATVKLENLRGELRGRDLKGTADLELTPQPMLVGNLSLQSGESTIRVVGERGEEMNARAELLIATLNDWLPNASGRLEAQFTAQGEWPELVIAGTARGSDIDLETARVERLALNLNLKNPKDPSGEARIELTNADSAGFEFTSLVTTAAGSKADHTLTLQAAGSPVGADLRLVGVLKDDTWTGTLEQLGLDVERAAQLRLQSPATVAYSPEGTSLSELCLIDDDIRLCAEGQAETSGALQARYSLQGIPLQLANVFAPTLPLALSGEISGSGDVRRTAEGTLFGDAQLRLPSARIAQAVVEGEEQQTLLTITNLALDANLAGTQASGRIGATLDERGELRADVSASGLGEAVSPLRGDLRIALPSLAAIELFTPQLAAVQGEANVVAQFAGSVQEPEWTGEASIVNFAADVPTVGLRLRNGRVEASPQPSGDIRLAGRIESGKGHLEFTGNATPDGLINVDVGGRQFLAADLPGARVLVTPDLVFSRDVDRMELTGKVTVPTAAINLQKLPRGGPRVQQASPDVVVIDAQEQVDPTQDMPLRAEITVVLGDEVEITGYGLEAQVDGQLVVLESPGEVTRGSGEVRVAGQYKAYGQDLSIQRGQVLFAGTPIDNPRLNIEAVREIEASDVTAGIRITGEAQNPVLTLFSDPAMGQADALAYLVTGKPLSSIGQSSGEEGDLMQTAARSLGTATGGLLAKKLGARLGVDEVGIEDNEMIGGSAFTVGEYLSPRLYLSYGIGLFEPGEVVTLRYELSDDLSIQAQRGPEDTRAGIQYRMER